MPYQSGFNTATIGVVFMVVHNSLGQNVEVSTATLWLAAQGNGTAYLIPFGLAPGGYSATFFATNMTGYAITGTTTVSFGVAR